MSKIPMDRRKLSLDLVPMPSLFFLIYSQIIHVRIREAYNMDITNGNITELERKYGFR